MIDQRGAALLIALGILVMLSFIGIAAVMTSNMDISISGSSKRASQAFYVAEAGLQRATYDHLWSGFSDENLSPISDLFSWLESQEGVNVYDSVALGSLGNYTVTITSVTDLGRLDPFTACREVTLESVGEMVGGSETKAIREVVRLGVLPSEVFDYGYSIHHRGSFAGGASGKVIINGNARSNSHYDLPSGYVTINGNPRYDLFSGSAIDHGGVYSAGYVLPPSGAGYEGMVQYAENRHSYGGVDNSRTDPAVIPMPNLNDGGDADGDGDLQELNPYFLQLANGELGAAAGRVGIDRNHDGTLQADEVIFVGSYGDETGETGNVILAGTSDEPILIEGLVVVAGNLVIKGNLSGQGAFYVGRNTYIAADIIYDDPPSEPPIYNYGYETPAEYKQRLDAWIEANADKDLVSFQTRENVVAGDFTKELWTNDIMGGGLQDYRNDGKEDVGIDGVFGSLNDPDNPYGASEKEADGYWTVELYNTSTGERVYQDLEIIGGVAQVPSGWTVVPGTAEDVDGDGEYDDPYDYDVDIALDVQWNSSNFLNFDPGISTYSQFADNLVGNIDGVNYTNHALAGTFRNQVVMNGGIIARNECTLPSLHGCWIKINHDPRLRGGALDYWTYLPLVKAIVSVGWEEK